MDQLKRRFPRYSKLLALYPPGYRKEYGEQQLQTLADMLDDSHKSRSAVWARTLLDLPVSIVKQQISYTGEAMADTTPSYLKRNALLGAWLVGPFFLLVILNGIIGKHLQRSIFWHTNVLFIWLVLLPALAIIFNIAALLRWVQQRRHETKQSAWRVLRDVRRSWPVLTIIIVGIGILAFVFGHDSTHCVTGNPVRELRNAHQTILCIQRG